MKKGKKHNFVCRIISIILVLSLIYSLDVWAMGENCKKEAECLAPGTGLPLLNGRIDAVSAGEIVLRKLENLGITDTDKFYKAVREGQIEKGAMRYIVLLDQKDNTKRAVYVFDGDSGYFSRITNAEKVDDLLYGILSLDEEEPAEERKIDYKGRMWHQQLFYLKEDYIPVVESIFHLFYGEEFNPEVRYKAVDLKRVLEEVINRNRKILDQYKQKAKDAAYALVDVGAVREENLSQINSLLTKIAENSGDIANNTYSSLQDLAVIVKEEGLNPVVLDLGLLTTIAENAQRNADSVYITLGALAEAVKDYKLAPAVLELDSLTLIAKKLGEKADIGYSGLKDIVGVVATKLGQVEKPQLIIRTILNVLVNPDVQDGMPNLMTEDTGKFFQLLLDFISNGDKRGVALVGVEITRYNLITNLEQFVLRMALYYWIAGKMPGSYVDLVGDNKKFYRQFKKDIETMFMGEEEPNRLSEISA